MVCHPVLDRSVPAVEPGDVHGSQIGFPDGDAEREGARLVGQRDWFVTRSRHRAGQEEVAVSGHRALPHVREYEEPTSDPHPLTPSHGGGDRPVVVPGIVRICGGEEVVLPAGQVAEVVVIHGPRLGAIALDAAAVAAPAVDNTARARTCESGWSATAPVSSALPRGYCSGEVRLSQVYLRNQQAPAASAGDVAGGEVRPGGTEEDQDVDAAGSRRASRRATAGGRGTGRPRPASSGSAGTAAAARRVQGQQQVEAMRNASAPIAAPCGESVTVEKNSAIEATPSIASTP